jgi:hypothetical protein
MLALGLGSILAIIIGTKIATAPKGSIPAAINAFQDNWNEIIEPHRAV